MILCAKGQSIVLETASGSSLYLWSTSSTSSNITISPSISTSYWVIGNEGPCNDSAKYSVGVYPAISAEIPLVDTICSGKPVSIQVNASGGKAPYTYSWNNGIVANSPGPITVNPTITTTYIVNISDACNYMATDSVKVTISKSGVASFNIVPDTIISRQ